MPQSNYNENDGEFGELAQQFFKEYEDYLANIASMWYRDMAKVVKIEGLDYVAFIMREDGLFNEGGQEVKGYGNRNTIRYGVTYHSQEVIVGFEMYDLSTKGEGWLYKLTHSEECGIHGEFGAVHPLSLAIICYDDRDATPYASIVFEDFSKLEQRLAEISKKEFGYDLTSEEWLPKAKWSNYQGHETGVHPAFWNVPLRLLADLATVTMIDDDLTFGETYQGKVQKARYDELKRFAGGRHLSTTDVNMLRKSIKEKHHLPEKANIRKLEAVLPFIQRATQEERDSIIEAFGEPYASQILSMPNE